MCSKDFGANWDFVARNIHQPRYTGYLTYDYTWSVINLHANVFMRLCGLQYNYILGVNLVWTGIIVKPMLLKSFIVLLILV